MLVAVLGSGMSGGDPSGDICGIVRIDRRNELLIGLGESRREFDLAVADRDRSTSRSLFLRLLGGACLGLNLRRRVAIAFALRERSGGKDRRSGECDAQHLDGRFHFCSPMRHRTARSN